MKKFLFILLLIFSSTMLFAQKQNHNIEAAVKGFFNGLSLVDADTLQYYSTGDFQLLDDGHVWNLDTLISKVMPRKNSGITRTNSFQFIRTEISGSMAWLSYHNSADFRKDDKQQTMRWLESAVLMRENGRWKLQLLHSTKLK